ncbi:MAG: DUF4139 domain-containing protein [Candidatus Binatia bacterium]|nr:MAG: DUF4139 domain-containing protein [Candidatus Binatia bacterium]
MLGPVLGFAGLFLAVAFGEVRATQISSERGELALTVYHENVAFVLDRREVRLARGRELLAFREVPSSLVPESLLVRDPDGNVVVRRERFAYDLGEREKLLSRYVGKSLEIVDRNPATGEDRVLEAVLLQASPEPVYRIGEEIHLGLPARLVLPPLPDLVVEPTVFVDVEASRAGVERLDLSYLVEGIAWQADYSLLARDEEGELAVQATIRNGTELSYPAARLELVAGEIRRGREPRIRAFGARMAEVSGGAASPRETPAGEFYLYAFPEPVDLPAADAVRLPLLESRKVPLRVRYYLERSGRFAVGESPVSPREEGVDYAVEIENTERAGLGLALPAGKVRVYTDSGGTLRFAGEDTVRATARGGLFSVRPGKAFDVVATRRQSDYKVLGRDSWETEWEVAIRNEKKKEVLVEVFEEVSHDWEVVSSTHPHEVVDARTIRFPVKVPAGKTKTLRYRLRVRARR